MKAKDDYAHAHAELLATPLEITGDVPAIDHHSHAAYVRPGESLRTFDALETENAAGYVESRIPSEAYQSYVTALRMGNDKLAESLAGQHGIRQLQRRGRDLYGPTGFGRALKLGRELMYGPGTEEEHIRRSAEGLKDYRGLYDDALRISNTRMVLTDVPELDSNAWPDDRYRQIARIDPYLYPFGHETYEGRGSDTPRFAEIFAQKLDEEREREGLDSLPESLSSYEDFVQASLTRRIRDGVVGLKLASAYLRSLKIERTSYGEASRAYETLADAANGDSNPTARRVLSDYLIAAIARIAVGHDMPMQIHVGMGHAEPGLRLSNANPLLLEEFLHIPDLNRLRVVLIHGGYPYSSSLGAMAHAYGNVYLDYSWMPYLHEHLTARVLQEWLEYLPANKIMYGTDTPYPEVHVGATARAREALENVLNAGLKSRLWDHQQVGYLAGRVLHDNLCELYNFD